MNEFNKLTLTSTLAHFKNSSNGKNQLTFDVPPPSTIIGILKNIYGQDIQNFIFGYEIKYSHKTMQVETIYKEIKLQVTPKSKRFQSDICFLEYLVNPIITIYHNLQSKIQLSTQLNLGKSNCLTKCQFDKVNLLNENGIGFNQWCPIDVGQGKIRRINKETVYNVEKGIFDYYTDLFRLNEEFNSNHIIEDNQNGIQLWKYEGKGKLKCYQENI